MVSTSLSGWGANLRANCVLVQPETPAQVAHQLDRAGTVPRGLALEQWLPIKQKYDPSNVFTSNLARRLGMLS